MASTKLISISNLQLDTNNPRFPEPQDGERAAINKMLQIQGDRIIQLARDICEFGVDPSEKVMVIASPNREGDYIVLEGNRRTTVLKVLNNPELIDDEKIKTQFSKLSRTATDLPASVECYIVDKEEQAEHWIKLKHTGQNSGRSRVNWDTVEQDRFLASQGNQSYLSQFITYVQREDSFAASRELLLSTLKATNLTRLLTDPDIRLRMNLETNNQALYCQIPPSSFFDKALKLLEEISGKGVFPNFTVDTIYYKEDRRDFFDSIGIFKDKEVLEKPWLLTDPQNAKERLFKLNIGQNQPNAAADVQDDLSQEPEQNQPVDDDKSSSTNQESNTGKRLVNPPDINRKRLIPPTTSLKISNQKCLQIFKELKSHLNPVDKYTYSVSVMIRVFLELSITDYFEAHLPGELAKLRQERKTGLHDRIVYLSEHFKM